MSRQTLTIKEGRQRKRRGGGGESGETCPEISGETEANHLLCNTALAA